MTTISISRADHARLKQIADGRPLSFAIKLLLDSKASPSAATG